MDVMKTLDKSGTADFHMAAADVFRIFDKLVHNRINDHFRKNFLDFYLDSIR